MSTRKLAFLIALGLLALGGAAGSVLWALWQVPDFYEEVLTEVPDPEVRKAAAKTFVQRTLQLVDDIKHADAWSEKFEQQQVNSWLAEELHAKYGGLVPREVSEPRVRFLDDRIQVGFRLEQKDWRGVVSVRVRAWAPDENRLALEVQSARAGLLPIPLDNVLKQIVRHVEREGWRVEWTQSNGNDVLVVDLDSGRADAPVLESIEVVEGAIRIAGRRSAAGGSKHFELPRLADKSREK